MRWPWAWTKALEEAQPADSAQAGRIAAAAAEWSTAKRRVSGAQSDVAAYERALDSARKELSESEVRERIARAAVIAASKAAP